MEEKQEINRNVNKLYSETAIRIGVFFGGPLAGCYLMAKNYNILEKAESAKKAIIGGLIGTLFLLFLFYIIPNQVFEKTSSPFIPLIYIAITSFYVSKYQGNFLKEHKENGGEFHSRWRAVGIGLLFSLILVVGILLVFTIKPPFPGPKSVYGVKNHEIYYSEGIDKGTIDNTAKYFTQIGMFQNMQKIIVQIIKNKKFYIVRLPIQKQYWDDSSTIGELQLIRVDLQKNIFNDSTKLIVFQDELSGISEKEITGTPSVFPRDLYFENNINTAGLLSDEFINENIKTDISRKIDKKTANDVHIGIILTYTETEGQKVLNEIEKGLTFEEAAKKHSHGPNAQSGGDIGFINPIDMGKEISDIIDKTLAGEISSLVKVENGFLIIKNYN